MVSRPRSSISSTDRRVSGAASVLNSSSRMRSGADRVSRAASRRMSERVSGSMPKPVSAARRAALRSLSGSSVNTSSETALTRPAWTSPAPSRGSMRSQFPETAEFRSTAIASMVKSRRRRSASMSPPVSLARSITTGDCAPMTTLAMSLTGSSGTTWPFWATATASAVSWASPLRTTSTSAVARPIRPSRTAPPTMYAGTPRSERRAATLLTICKVFLVKGVMGWALNLITLTPALSLREMGYVD